ncbi:TRAP transporter small permease [Marinobacterium jannaschii]|uniref:TRAP transporter small permease n=1 Tax=Marinobacterium jannaschii TaxID=64970 RepID=UPI0005646BB9|nr:TRAP transporter small permease [Marinobacterium jannaschii]
MRWLLKLFNNLESYLCRALLAGFVLLLFMQIVSRQLFGYSFSWTEELSVYMFVWFVYLGASYAAKLSAHNRVTFQLKWLPPKAFIALEVITDLIWLAFNCSFIWLSYDFVFNRMNLFWKSQTLGIPMKYIYMILPFAFLLMSIRILQVNYVRIVKGVDVQDPESEEMDKIISEEKARQQK